MVRPELLVGLDVGTTSSKAVVYGPDGAPLALGGAATPWHTVRGPAASSAIGTELDAFDLLNAARAALSRALAGAPEGRVVGVGVTSMAESGVLLDARGEPIAPVIAWHDTRDVDQVARLGADIRTDGHHAVVRGKERLSGAPVRATDIRAGAGLIMAGLVAEGVTTVSDGYHLDRGYPGFDAQLRSLGAEIVREPDVDYYDG